MFARRSKSAKISPLARLLIALGGVCCMLYILSIWTSSKVAIVKTPVPFKNPPWQNDEPVRYAVEEVRKLYSQQALFDQSCPVSATGRWGRVVAWRYWQEVRDTHPTHVFREMLVACNVSTTTNPQSSRVFVMHIKSTNQGAWRVVYGDGAPSFGVFEYMPDINEAERACSFWGSLPTNIIYALGDGVLGTGIVTVIDEFRLSDIGVSGSR